MDSGIMILNHFGAVIGSTQMSKHVKEIELYKKGISYALEIDAEDDDNLVIESVTQISGTKLEHDIDPDIFEDSLDSDDWKTIREKLETTS